MRFAIALAALLAPLLAAPPAQAGLRWRDCRGVPCTELHVPLDRSGAVPGTISLHVERVHASARPSRGLNFLLAGGPGQSATSAYAFPSVFEDERYDEFASIHDDLVVFDQRGTGQSGLLRCRDLEWANGLDPGTATASCASLLGRRRSHYTTSDSVDDLEAVRQALGGGKVTLIGVSYGTYLAQRYAIRYPGNVARLVLDSVVDTDGVDPLYRDTFAATRRTLGRFCARRCGFKRDPVADVGALVAQLAKGPLRGAVVQPNGSRRPAELTRKGLLFLFGSGDLEPDLRSSFPGAVLSALRGDVAPILRLQAQGSSAEGGDSARDLSTAVLAATACEEVSFPYPRETPPGARAHLSLLAAEGSQAPFAPFDAFTAGHNDLLRFCRTWPTAATGPTIEQAPLPDVPALLLAGGMDTRTPIETARRVAARLPHSTLVIAPRSGHSLIGNSSCANRALALFLRDKPPRVTCRQGGSILALPSLPTSLKAVRPVKGVAGARGRVLRTFELTLNDSFENAFSDFDLNLDAGTIRGPGLRGGWFTVHLIRPTELRLHQLEFVPGVRISGRVTSTRGNRATGAIRITGDGGPNGRLRVSGSSLIGRLGGELLHYRLPRTAVRALGARAVRSRPRAHRLLGLGL
jgi:pimeloyl-ACP methyl ester carboxylesterase